MTVPGISACTNDKQGISFQVFNLSYYPQLNFLIMETLGQLNCNSSISKNCY